ncbi:unnamed protein product [Adineta steineri]|uniref:RBR-type E3 ubiquitin transferase n=1 Tax=Adineta steineri TaxID=433720 RepID=A0A814ELK5_9BILA|nr:unnamed protein product [Adineta steineri]CAF0970878.1 unnamed protein product [Adineta steineri]
MASNYTDDEKPNLRPIRRSNANGKSLYLHYNPNQLSNKSYIQATWNNTIEKQDPFGIEQPNVTYSLNKNQRWQLLNDIRQYITNQSSSSDDELNTQSDSEQKRKTKKSQQKTFNQHQVKYRLYEYHNTPHNNNNVRITTNSRKRENNDADVEDNNVTYVTVVPPSQEKCLPNIRKKYGSKSKKTTSSTQRTKCTQIKERLDFSEDEKENLSTDDDESITSYYTSIKHDKLQLNDFIPIKSTKQSKNISSKSINSNTTDKFHSKPSHIYYDDNHSSTENRKQNNEIVKSETKLSNNFMSLSYRTIFLHRTDFKIEHLSKVYGKNFIHAQCYPVKYLICLTDRLKSVQPKHFSLNCYLIIILTDDVDNQDNFCQGQVSLNMDLNTETIEIENLSQSKDTIYKIDDLINKTIDFITKLSLDLFKPIDLEINQRKYIKDDAESELSENEFINKQIHRVKNLDKTISQNKLILNDLNNNNNISIDDYNLIRPSICTTCYCDINESISMTVLKSCGHGLCDQCWKQYLENSVKNIKVILCPEWNCCSIVDAGTILSLVNVRCMNIYERNIEKCLVNLSHSYVKCPSKFCPNIVQIINSHIDNVRCRCGHQFCIDCKQEPHFPALCSSYRAYIKEASRNGDLVSNNDTCLRVEGRNCISCQHFIVKDGGCNHMTCRCGVQFCWLCSCYWKDHYNATQEFACPKPTIALQKMRFVKERHISGKLYDHAIFHRHQRAYQNQIKQNENCKRLIGTIPLDKQSHFDTILIKSQIDKREALLKHCYEIVKYIHYLHRICEFIAVAADGYANNPAEFFHNFYPLETIALNLSQILKDGRGYQAIEQLNHLHKTSEKLIERLRQSVILRQKRSNGYMTS